MSSSKIRYLSFPICHLRKIIVSPSQGIEEAMNFGIKHASKSIGEDILKIYNDICYKAERDRASLSDGIWSEFEKELEEALNYADIDDNLDQYFYNFSANECTEIGHQVMTRIYCNVEIWQEAVDVYKKGAAARLIQIKPGNKQLSSAKFVEDIHSNQTKKYGKFPFVSMTTQSMFKFRDNPENIEVFIATAAIRSLQYMNEYTETNKETIRWRMIGAKNKESLQEAIEHSDKSEAIYKKYSVRHHFDNLMSKLMIDKYLASKIGYGRKIYLSTRLSMEDLSKAIENRVTRDSIRNQEKEYRKKIATNLK